MSKFLKIFLNTIPVIIMIGLIPLVENDYILTLIFAIMICVLLLIKRAHNDILIFVLGFIVMIICESLFVSTGVETFVRNSLFGLMPLWLPFLWGYGFVVIKRSVLILNE